MKKEVLNKAKKDLKEELDFIFCDFRINLNYFIDNDLDDLDDDDLERIVKAFDHSKNHGFLELIKEYVNIY